METHVLTLREAEGAWPQPSNSEISEVRRGRFPMHAVRPASTLDRAAPERMRAVAAGP